MTLTLHRESTLERPAPELKRAPRPTEMPTRHPPRRRWLVPAGLVAALVVGGLVLSQQGNDSAQPTPEYPVDAYTPAGAMLDDGVLDGVFPIPDAPMLKYDTYTPQGVLSNDVLDGVFVIPEAPWLRYDTYTTPGTRPTAGMIDGVYGPADPPQLPAPPDVYSGRMPQPGLPDGEWVRPQVSPIHPCPISGPC